MTDKKEFQTLSELAELLREAQSDKESGVFFLVTDRNRSASLAFIEGSLVDARFGPKKGNAALELINEIERCTVKFNPAPPPASSLGGAGPLDIGILLLGSGKKTADQLAVIEGILSGYIGPAARTIIEDVSEQEDDIEMLLNKVSVELGDAEEQMEFLRKAREQLSK